MKAFESIITCTILPWSFTNRFSSVTKTLSRKRAELNLMSVLRYCECRRSTEPYKNIGDGDGWISIVCGHKRPL